MEKKKTGGVLTEHVNVTIEPVVLYPGDIVMLKSGGPMMTVRRRIEIEPQRIEIECEWFDGLGLKAAHFCADSLARFTVNRSVS